MPIRPRSHQLEDISLNKFEALLPNAWVVRHKGKDYGIDLEVEIFEVDGKATGLTFLVQMRATDDLSRAEKLSLTFDQLEYFRRLDLPTLVVRYCATNDSFCCQWHFNIIGQAGERSGKSFTYKFEARERWDANAPASIKRTLAIRRALKSWPAGRPITVTVQERGLGPRDKFLLNDTFSAIVRSVQDTLRSDEEGGLTVEVCVSSSQTLIAIDCLTSIKIDTEIFDHEKFSADLVYGLILLLSRQGLDYHARRLAALAQSRELTHSDRTLIFAASMAALPETALSVSLAISNGLQNQHDPFYALYITALLKAVANDPVSDAAVQRFYDEAALSAAAINPDSEAAVHYSLGNFHRARNAFAKAVKCYRKARQLRPAYLQADYYLQELGSCMYLTRHFRCAAALYRAAFAKAPSDRDLVLLGDALLFSGEALSAEQAFARAANSGEAIIQYEAIVKGTLCRWLIELTGDEVLPVRRAEASRLMPFAEAPELSLCDEIVRRVDSTSAVAHYNLGVARATAGHFQEALGSFVLCGVSSHADLDAWANAIICAWNAGEPTQIISVMACALSLAGRQAYDRLRDILVEQNAEAGMLEGLDTLVVELAQLSSEGHGGVSVRALRDALFDVVTPQVH